MPWPYGKPKILGVDAAPVHPRTSWLGFIQFWRAVGERVYVSGGETALGPRVFPKGNQFFFHGTVTAATETSITDTGQTEDDHWPHAWYGYDPGETPDPSAWDVVVDLASDERKTVRMSITSA